jgi:hypothetical protein
MKSKWQRLVYLAKKKYWKYRWIYALLFGGYAQTTGRLMRMKGTEGKEGYCCLGVLCDVVNPSGWRMHEAIMDESFAPNHTLGRKSAIPAFLGLSDKAGSRESSLGFRLAQMNDKGSSFKEIAKVIWKEF